MGIKKEFGYIVKCDICKEEYQCDEDDGFFPVVTLFIDNKKKMIKEWIEKDGWKMYKDGRILCEDCLEE